MNITSDVVIYYLTEFRKRLFICLIIFLIFFSICIYFANSLYTVLAYPLLRCLPKGQGLISTHMAAPFFVPIELGFFVACFAAVPFFLYHLWAFITPALYLREKKVVGPLLFLSVLLFFFGVFFAYEVVLPLLFSFLANTQPQGVSLMPDITQYLEFTLRLFLMFGVIFEVPLMTVVCVRAGMVERAVLIRMRPYVIVGSFVVGMLFSPPDIVSQTCLAIPLWLLFELGILLSGWI